MKKAIFTVPVELSVCFGLLLHSKLIKVHLQLPALCCAKQHSFNGSDIQYLTLITDLVLKRKVQKTKIFTKDFVFRFLSLFLIL